MSFLKPILLASTFLSMCILSAQAEPKVVTSIKPVHSLVAAVMEGVGSPTLLVTGANSPHSFALKPSQAATLESADLVFWIGHELETFLEKPLEIIASKAKSVELIDAHDLIKLELREGGAFDEHAHEGGHAKDEDHDHEEKAEDDHDEHSENEEHEGHDEHKKHAGHSEGAFNPHVWLDPVNAKALVHEIEAALVKSDPENTAKYEANAKSMMTKLDSLVVEVSDTLAPVKGNNFIVFHDAYQNFEERFGLSAIGSITVSPEVILGAKRIRELQTKVTELKAICVFSEPQFDTKLVATVTEGTSAKMAVIDPLGTSIDDGPELYFKLIRNMANSFKACLSNPN